MCIRDRLNESDFTNKRIELLERHARVYNRYSTKERYRNLPLVDDKRCLVDGRQLPTDPLPW